MPIEDFSYNKTVMDHFQNPRNAGEVENADVTAETRNPHCGDAILLGLKIEGDTITDVKFLTFGCGAAIATSSIATEMFMGKTISEASAITPEDIIKELGGLPEHKLPCAKLAPEALQIALDKYHAK
ncbi:iron-sulfur cluster assembly scaffold protein [bacterium AH-315-J21]|nr:iron-sulfur cluster assembly scaffold protein [bacterium AH-315-J21]